MLGGNHTFNSGSSSTYKLWNKPFYIIYGDGTYVNGTWANDTVNVCESYFLCQEDSNIVFCFHILFRWLVYLLPINLLLLLVLLEVFLRDHATEYLVWVIKAWHKAVKIR